MSYAGEVLGGFDAWLLNSYRFATVKEAESFIRHLKETWQPAGFIHSTRTVRSKDPVTHRWDVKRQEVVLLPVVPANDPMVAATVTVEGVELKDGENYGSIEELDEPAALVDEASYRPRTTAPKKLSWRRRFSIEVFRAYRDRTQWRDREQAFETYLADVPRGYGIISDELRHDLRHLLANGSCRFELTRRLFDFYMTAHLAAHGATYRGNRPEEKLVDTGEVKINPLKRKLVAAEKVLRAAPNSSKAQTAYNKAEKSFGASGGDVVAYREAIKIVRGELRYETDDGEVVVVAPTQRERMIASEMESVLEVCRESGSQRPRAAPIDMQDLTRWLATPEGHSYIGWYSYKGWAGEDDDGWRGSCQTQKDLIAALPIEETAAELPLQELEAAELAKKMRDRKQRAERMEMYDAILDGSIAELKARKLSERRKFDQRLDRQYQQYKMPSLQKFVARHGGNVSSISMKDWGRFNQEVEEWKKCIGCNDNWADPQWRRWFAEKTIEIWGDKVA